MSNRNLSPQYLLCDLRRAFDPADEGNA